MARKKDRPPEVPVKDQVRKDPLREASILRHAERVEREMEALGITRRQKVHNIPCLRCEVVTHYCHRVRVRNGWRKMKAGGWACGECVATINGLPFAKKERPKHVSATCATCDVTREDVAAKLRHDGWYTTRGGKWVCNNCRRKPR